MRWEELFADLEGSMRAEELMELEAEVADRTRRERALLGLQERLLSGVDAGTAELRVAGLGPLRGVVTDVGADWVLVAQGREQAVLVAFSALRWVTVPGGRLQPLGAVARTFGIGAALRAVSRDRAVVDVVDLEGGSLTGTVDAVGRDVLDLAEHPADLPRRPENVRVVRSVPFSALAAVRRRR
ncbi:MAG: hypothetical protein M3Y71_03980 [Actinomycetota bacterium]|nr:hypothetical protein [Actinomycetota bacterium]